MTINQMFGSSPNNEAETVTEVLPDGYKKTELGIIPTEWYVESIGNLVSITTGSKNTQDRIENGAYPFFVRSQTVERINTYSFDGEGVLTAGDGVGTGKIFHYINGKFDFHQRVYLMYNFGEKLDGFFFYKFFSNNFYDRIMSMTAKSSVDSVRREMIADMKMLVPTRNEQTAIANALSDVDALIQELEKLIAKKQAIKTATMQQLLTGRTRLPQFAHHPDGRKKGYKPSELGEIPEDWEVLGFGSLYQPSITKKSIKQNCQVTFVGMQDVTEQAQLVGQHVVSVEKVKSGFTYFERGDVLVAKITPCFENGKGCHTESLQTEIGYGSTEFHVLRTTDNSDSMFVYYWTTRDNFRNALESEMVGSAGHRRVPLAAIANYQIPVPPKSEQTAIATILSDMDGEIQSLDQRLNKTRQIKQGMMQELLTGKTRLVKPVGLA